MCRSTCGTRASIPHQAVRWMRTDADRQFDVRLLCRKKVTSSLRSERLMLYYSGASRTPATVGALPAPAAAPGAGQPACLWTADGLAELRHYPPCGCAAPSYLGRLDGATAPYRYRPCPCARCCGRNIRARPGQLPPALWQRDQMCGSEPLPEPVPGLDRVTTTSFRPPAKSAATMCRNGWQPCGRWACRSQTRMTVPAPPGGRGSP